MYQQGEYCIGLKLLNTWQEASDIPPDERHVGSTLTADSLPRTPENPLIRRQEETVTYTENNVYCGDGKLETLFKNVLMRHANTYLTLVSDKVCILTYPYYIGGYL